MKYFNNIKNLDDLKKQYRDLALKNHPDVGGDPETMKAINAEYDLLFPMYKTIANVSADETAQSTRSEFYTQNGWKGENYNSSISTKEIACIMREYIKDVHNNYRFSIRIEYNHIFITMTESPEHPFVNPNVKHNQLNQYALSRDMDLTNEARSVMLDILKVLNSYRMDDSDGMIDYFHTNFYISLNIGSWDKDIKIVPREKKTVSGVEYETVEITSACIRIYRELARRDLTVKIQEYAAKMGVNPTGLKINSAKTCLSSYTSANSLNFSWRLIMMDDDAIDYVVVYELAHILECKHSTRFWEIIEDILPDYKNRKIKLKELKDKFTKENWYI